MKNFDWSVLALPWESVVFIIAMALILSGITLILLKKNINRAKKMKLKIGEEVGFSNPASGRYGKVISDGDSVTIEIKVPRHLVYKK